MKLIFIPDCKSDSAIREGQGFYKLFWYEDINDLMKQVKKYFIFPTKEIKIDKCYGELI